ncbi:Serpin-32 [Operophtera brumata]|uniref:Serpin-32 n=1 Tax=Operophtera brumata TaxID=104452 RepID=A0A0L7LSG9_OPEBR|nr:Serpin-32 [Operophtera brumata]
MLKAFAIVFLSYAFAAPTVDFSPLNEFSLQLLDHTYTYQENFGKSNKAISPVSVWSLFSLLAEGSSGQTFQELVKELRLPTDLRATQALHLATNNLLKSDFQDVLLKGKSAMFSDCSLQIHPEFCEAATSYSTDIYSVDPKNTTKLAHDINYYICLATEGRITHAVQEENLENLRLILVDALYFKANWTYPFDSTQTREEAFYDYQGKTIGSVNMMYHKAPHNFGDANEIQATVLEMTYGKNEEFSMHLLLPFEGTSIKKLLSNLAAQPLSWINDIRIEGDIPEIDVYVPRFKISSKSDLIPPLQYLGIQSIFDVQRAELPGVSDSPLFISSAAQNVDIEVTEEGTVAAAATVVGLQDRILGQRFEANRDFVFLITERKSNLILFAGVYEEPSVV